MYDIGLFAPSYIIEGICWQLPVPKFCRKEWMNHGFGSDFEEGTLKIILIDDDEVIRLLLTKYLEDLGHACVAVDNGADLLKALKEEKYDLVITDRGMPGITGDQLALKVKQQNPDIPVVMLTGSGRTNDEASVLPPGVDAVVGKPVTVEDLEKAIAEVMGGD